MADLKHFQLVARVTGLLRMSIARRTALERTISTIALETSGVKATFSRSLYSPDFPRARPLPHPSNVD